MDSNEANSNPRPNLPSLMDKPSSSQSSSSGGIRLPPISLLHAGNQMPMPRLLNEPPKDGGSQLPGLPPLSQFSTSKSFTPTSAGSDSGILPFNASTAPPLPLKEEITKPEIESESDEDIIKYYEQKYEITDFTPDEKHDILQHEKRARIEKQRNPNYKTYLCYSIIKRLNAMKDPKKPEEPKPESETPMIPLSTLPAVTSEPPAPSVPAPQDTSAQSPLDTRVQLHTNGSAPPATQQPPTTAGTETSLATTTAAEATTTTAATEPPKFVKREVIINNKDVLEYASKFPRKHIGSLIYNPAPTKESYKQLSCFRDLKVSEASKTQIVPLLPELREHINSIITVRVPSWQITDLRNNTHYQNRSIWGTDIYTDDSDVLLMLKHNGFLPLVDEEVEGDGPTMEKRTPGNVENQANISQSVTNFRQFVNIIGGDVHVDLIILPPLVEYAGSFRNGVNSRSWTSGHDGMSVAIYGVRYGEKGSAVESVNDAVIKKRKLAELEALKHDAAGGAHWKLNREALKKAKLEMEAAKNKETAVEDK